LKEESATPYPHFEREKRDRQTEHDSKLDTFEYMSFEQKRNRNIHCSVDDFEKLNSRKDFEDFDGLREERDQNMETNHLFFEQTHSKQKERDRTSMASVTILNKS
jgi:hypothetical protein